MSLHHIALLTHTLPIQNTCHPNHYPDQWPHLQGLLQTSLQSIAEHHNSDEQAAEQCNYNEPGQQEDLPTGEAACIQGVLTHTTGNPVGADGGQAHHHQDVGNHVDLCVVHHLKKESYNQRQ